MVSCSFLPQGPVGQLQCSKDAANCVLPHGGLHGARSGVGAATGSKASAGRQAQQAQCCRDHRVNLGRELEFGQHRGGRAGSVQQTQGLATAPESNRARQPATLVALTRRTTLSQRRQPRGALNLWLMVGLCRV